MLPYSRHVFESPLVSENIIRYPSSNPTGVATLDEKCKQKHCARVEVRTEQHLTGTSPTDNRAVTPSYLDSRCIRTIGTGGGTQNDERRFLQPLQVCSDDLKQATRS